MLGTTIKKKLIEFALNVNPFIAEGETTTGLSKSIVESQKNNEKQTKKQLY